MASKKISSTTELYKSKIDLELRQSGLVVSELYSCGFKSRLIQNTRWKWGQIHARINSGLLANIYRILSTLLLQGILQ
jgi:hypothetical protein